MKRINSKQTFFIKTIFPIIWFTICALALYTFLSPPSGLSLQELAKTDDDFGYIFLAIPIMMIITGFIAFKIWIWPLADKVYDESHSLNIKRSGREINLPLKDIEKIFYNSLINPPIITLTIKHDTAFGKKIKFIPLAKMLPYFKHDRIKDLIERIESQSR